MYIFPKNACEQTACDIFNICFCIMFIQENNSVFCNQWSFVAQMTFSIHHFFNVIKNSYKSKYFFSFVSVYEGWGTAYIYMLFFWGGMLFFCGGDFSLYWLTLITIVFMQTDFSELLSWLWWMHCFFWLSMPSYYHMDNDFTILHRLWKHSDQSHIPSIWTIADIYMWLSWTWYEFKDIPRTKTFMDVC